MDISLEKIRKLNDEIGLGKYGLSSSIRYSVALKYLDDECIKSAKVCEIGPGGVITYIAKYSDADVSAMVSPKEKHWDDIFKDYGIDLFQWDLNKPLDNKDIYESFDCIIFLETLEHLNRWPEHVLDDIHKLLRPNGILLLSTPNLVRLSNRIRMLFGRPPNNPFKYTPAGAHHVREYTLSELLEFMPNEKWEIKVSSYELPYPLGQTKLFKFLIKMFKTLIGTIIFIKVLKK
jgi:SAM-dependent methyltransferase